MKTTFTVHHNEHVSSRPLDGAENLVAARSRSNQLTERGDYSAAVY